jgi:hypothetical protein
MSMFAGIDRGGYHHQLCVVGEIGCRTIERRVAHDRAGLIELRNTLADVALVMRAAVERAEGLLVESLLDWGHIVYPVSPRVASRAPRSDTGRRRSRMTASTPSFSLTACATSTLIGGPSPHPATCSPSSRAWSVTGTV